MATLASVAERPVMDVVPAVAASACKWQRYLSFLRCFVTCNALQTCVCTRQRETSFILVVEVPQRPCTSVVAGVAGLAHAAFVGIVLLMAAHARLGRALVELVRMAARAGDQLVAAEQRKRGAVVVDHDLLPRIGDMATRAVVTELAAMRIIRGMAGDALHVELFAMRIVLVAGIASQRRVATRQREAGPFAVIEADLLP